MIGGGINTRAIFDGSSAQILIYRKICFARVAQKKLYFNVTAQKKVSISGTVQKIVNFSMTLNTDC